MKRKGQENEQMNELMRCKEMNVLVPFQISVCGWDSTRLSNWRSEHLISRSFSRKNAVGSSAKQTIHKTARSLVKMPFLGQNLYGFSTVSDY